MATNEDKIIWLAGLVDGEGCFTIRISKHHQSTLKIEPIFLLGMKGGRWLPEVKKVLASMGVRYRVRHRAHKNTVEVAVVSWGNIRKLAGSILPFSIVKKPLLRRLLQYKPLPHRNRFVRTSTKTVAQIANLVDYVRSFNRGKNRPYKWDGRKIHDFYAK